MSRSIKSEVISSSFDQDPMEHIKVAEITLSRAKRAAEDGRDVVILLDSLTRLTRAYNTTSPSSGRILTGGIDSNALQKPKKFFGAARSLEGSGSITIIASMLVETGSKMDDVIFEELHGRGNWNLELNRRLSELGLFPAVNLSGSGVRRCELLPDFNHQLYMTVRKYLASKTPSEALTLLLQKIKSTTNNNQLLSLLNGSQG
jgi:transcription termination factor Rho